MRASGEMSECESRIRSHPRKDRHGLALGDAGALVGLEAAVDPVEGRAGGGAVVERAVLHRLQHVEMVFC